MMTSDEIEKMKSTWKYVYHKKQNRIFLYVNSWTHAGTNTPEHYTLYDKDIKQLIVVTPDEVEWVDNNNCDILYS
jgi:hypothetical protein